MTLEHAMAIQNVLASLSSKELPFSASYKIAKISLGLEADSTFFKTKYREILEKYAIPESVGASGFQPKEGMEEEQATAINELFNCEIDEITIKFKFSELESLQLTPSDVAVLMPLIEE